MYKSYEYHNTFIEIIDDDFIEYIDIVGYGPTPSIQAASIIKIYSKRNLNVARNLVLFILDLNEKHFLNLAWIISDIKKNVQEFADYEKQVKELLVFK